MTLVNHEGRTPIMTDKDKIARYYDEGADYEYARLKRSPLHEAEWALTKDLLDEYVAPGSMVLDLGAGPGRYSEYLIKERHCSVGLIDLSQACLDLFLSRLDPGQRDKVLFARKGCATSLEHIPDASFDAVLLMGPMYHLLEPAERQAALAESKRALKPAGLIFASFISPYSLAPQALKSESALLASKALENALVGDGCTPADLRAHFTDHWCCWPYQARALMENNGFRMVRLRNLEGIGSLLRETQEQFLVDSERKAPWFGLLRATCEIPDVLGATIHFLYVGQARDSYSHSAEDPPA